MSSPVPHSLDQYSSLLCDPELEIPAPTPHQESRGEEEREGHWAEELEGKSSNGSEGAAWRGCLFSFPQPSALFYLELRH